MKRTHDLHVINTVPLPSPAAYKRELPMTEKANQTVVAGREAIQAILGGEDARLIVVVGPCSIHDEAAALEYAERLAALAPAVADQLLLVMRVYFEKPRTTIGWKGLIYDPYLNGSYDIAAGLRKAREIMLRVNEMGVPVATEMLDPITPQYLAEIVSWASLGARTTESQTHRQMASGLSMPVGYKNGTDGNLQIAIHAMQAARHPHSFLGIDTEGRACVVNTTGNPWGHLILRGGRVRPNYDSVSVGAAVEDLRAAGLPTGVMIDCSHDNSYKDHRRQETVLEDVINQRARGNTHIIGFMLESNLAEGRQTLADDPRELCYGVSITDACIGWEETERLLLQARRELHEAAVVRARSRPVVV